MKVAYSKYIPFKGFRAINLFGVFVIREEYRAFFDENPAIKAKLFNHESIHTQQMQEMLYLFFFYGMCWSGWFAGLDVGSRQRKHTGISCLRERRARTKRTLNI